MPIATITVHKKYHSSNQISRIYDEQLCARLSECKKEPPMNAVAPLSMFINMT